MKKHLIIFLISIGLNSYSQDRINVAANSTETFIETYIKNSNGYKLDQAYRLGPSSSKALKEGVKTALKWIDLNVTHQKDFEKEICRFKAMEKDDFKFHGYIEELVIEMIFNFKGKSDGTFVLEIKQYDSSSTFITFRDKDMVVSFKDLLDGKSANEEIDDIFKN